MRFVIARICHPALFRLPSMIDRLEVTSPGRLSPDLTIEQLIAGNSRVKNVAIGAAFQYMHIIEKWGSGIPRVFEDAESYGLAQPEIVDFGSSFRIILYRKPFETDQFGVKNPAVDEIKSGGLKEESAVGVLKSGDLDENPAVQVSKSGDLTDNPAVQDKPDDLKTEKIGWDVIDSKCAERKYNRSTIEKLKILYSSIKTEQYFSASTVRQITGCADSTARSLIAKLKEMDVVVSVQGRGKGVFRFKTKAE